MTVAVLRLPIGHCELNPIELIWAQVKRKIAVENRKFTVKGVEELAKKAITEVTAGNWQKCIEKVIKVENEWWEKDKLTDIEVDPLVIEQDSDNDSEDEDELFPFGDGLNIADAGDTDE